ncbi:hypothetical protein HYW72_01295 [Candidatus Nomurabacteria bacterium]|nr:hypothetical protein [Candidatus Nomurabacteria bacterium]
MFRDKKDLQKNLKDPERKPSASYGAGTLEMSVTGSYTKTNRLITALYMVTDIIDKDEPLRNKLRTLGTEMISDTYSLDTLARTVLARRINEIMSFLDIASAMNIISQMNCNILRKEFLELDQSIKESGDNVITPNKKINLAEFFVSTPPRSGSGHPSRGELNSKGHINLGVQKGQTLLKAIKDMSNKENPARNATHSVAGGFDALKKQRRENIVNIIKIMGGNATIKDIRDKAKSLPSSPGSLSSCGEKTLQRELVSMVKDGVLNKTGEKRWSRYIVI